MGKAVLEGLQGVGRVERGFRNWKETNTVHYDPSAITIDEMVRALTEAQTYLGTAEEKGEAKP